MATFITTQRGANKLLFEGYAYLKHKDGANDKIYWRCEQARTAQQCSGFAIAVCNEISVTKQHNHAPSPTRNEVQTIKHSIRTTASSQTMTPPRAIVNVALEGASRAAKVQLPELQNLQKTASRIRKATAIFTSETPKTLADVDIPNDLRITRTSARESFILHDTGPEDEQRIIALASRTDIARLTSCTVWMADGQFFSETRIHGCYFHFMQAVWRNIQDAGLAVPYKDYEDLRESLKCLSALAFCSPGHVRERFVGLAGAIMEDFGHNDGIREFLDYFERTWIGKGVATRPRFPIDMWNCHDITLDKLPRTTNSAESWHNTLNRVFTSNHPDPYKLINALLLENVRADHICVRLEAGQHVPLYSRPEYQEQNQRLLNIIAEYDLTDPIDFLQKCACFVHFVE